MRSTDAAHNCSVQMVRPSCGSATKPHKQHTNTHFTFFNDQEEERIRSRHTEQDESRPHRISVTSPTEPYATAELGRPQSKNKNRVNSREQQLEMPTFGAVSTKNSKIFRDTRSNNQL